MMLSQFKHQKLPTDKPTIRLIKIEKKKVDNEIACMIRHVELSSEKTVYSALSYVWGDPKLTREIRLRSDTREVWYTFALHENLWRFLNFAWNQGYFDCWYWTDCICLDQVSDEEKGHWIPRMGKIYFYAERVVAWLDLDMDVGDQLRPVRDKLDTMYPLERLDESWFLQNEVAGEAAEAVREAEYWSRIWIMQEVVSAKLVVCIVGNMQVDNITLGRMVAFPINHHARTWELLQKTLQQNRAFNLRRLEQHGLDSRSKKERPRLNTVDLWQLLALVTRDNYGYTKRHDLVYGVLGLAGTNQDGKDPVEHIKVDYSKSSAYVIMDALLESYSVWPVDWDDQRHKEAIHLLLREVDKESVFKVLEEYMTHNTTSERHRNLTRLLLRSCDAVYSVFETTALPPSGFCQQDTFRNLLRQLREKFLADSGIDYWSSSDRSDGSRRWKIQHNAIMLGIALVLENYHEQERGRVFDSWKAHREQYVLTSTQIWWCEGCLPSRRLTKQLQELSRGEELTPEWMELYQESRWKQKERDAQRIHCSVSTFANGLSKKFHEACACQKACISRNCDGSAMSFEILGAGFRLTLRNIRQLEKKLEIHIWISPPEVDDDLAGGPGFP